MPPPREQPPKSRRRQESMPGTWLWLVVLLILALFLLIPLNYGTPSIEYSEFINLMRDNKFKKVTLRGTTRLIGEVNSPDDLPEAMRSKVRQKRVEATIPENFRNNINQHFPPPPWKDLVIREEAEPTAWISSLVMVLFPLLLFVAIFVMFFLPRFRDPFGGGGFLSNYTKSPARKYEKNKMRVTFQDVAGMTYAKTELQEIVEFLKSPEKFQRLGAQIPKGVLLVGPPGTGKTLLARAVAGEAGVPFYSINGSEFIQMFVGVGASRVRDLFRTAKENAPCLLFIDEIDAVGRMRGAGVGGGSDEREQTLNQILSEMDGFTPTETVIVVAATNRPDVLDAALLRPGRFDRHVTIDRPTWQGRFEILKVHTRNKPLADNVDLTAIARRTIGMTGADLRNLANEAAILATRENKNRIERDDFENAFDRVILGPKREEVVSEDGKRRTAYHEAGHTIVGWSNKAGDQPTKVTIVPRGRAGGVTHIPPDEDRMHHGLDHYKATLATLMGGRAAERLIYKQTFSGVVSDLKQATNLARYMVTHYGMSDRLGPISFRIGEEHVFLGKEIQEQRNFSESSAAIIDEEVQKLLREADETAYHILETNRDKMERLVNALIEKEELLKDEIEAILGASPHNGKLNEAIAISPDTAM